jgi:hypothetical protein
MKRCFLALLPLLAALAACSRSNNLLLGRVEAQVGSHTVVVTDCYRTSVPPPESIGADLHFMPCRDADIWIRAGVLTVNGRSYGPIGPADGVLVDHGVVSIQRASPPGAHAKR